MAEDLARTMPEPAASTGAVPGPQLRRNWRSIMFAPVGDGQRRRRGSDGLRVAAAILALVCCVLIIRYDSRVDRAVIQVIHPPPRSITWLVTVVYDAGAFGVTIVLVLLVLLARRWVLARDIALSAAGTAVVPIGHVYRFDQIVEAHAAMEASSVSGKLVVTTPELT